MIDKIDDLSENKTNIVVGRFQSPTLTEDQKNEKWIKAHFLSFIFAPIFAFQNFFVKGGILEFRRYRNFVIKGERI